MRFVQILMLLYLTVSVGFAQNARKFHHLSIEQGLSQNTILSIGQDHRGFMWFGTYEGLNRFDGHHVKVYAYDPQDSLSLSNNNVYCLLGGENNKLWIGTYGGGLNEYDYKTEIFRHFRYDTTEYTIAGDYVLSLHEDSTYLWAGTAHGLSRIHKKTEEIKNFLNDPDTTIRKYEYTISAIFNKGDHILWLGTWFDGLIKFDLRDETYEVFSYDSLNINSISSNTIFRIEEFSDNELIIATDKGFNIFDFSTEKFKRKSLGMPGNKDIIQDLAKDQKGNFWLSSNDGLVYFDTQKNEMEIHKSVDNDSYSLSDNDILKCYIDKSGICWFGGSRGGVNYYIPGEFNFENIIHYPDSGMLPDKEVFSLIEDSNKKLWIGTLKGVVEWNHFDNSYELYQHIPSDQNSLTNNYIWEILEDHKGNMWFGTDEGLNKLNPKTGGIVRYYSDRGERILTQNQVYSLAEDTLGNIWIGTIWGLTRYNPETGEFNKYISSAKNNNGMRDNRVWQIHTDSKGTVWFGTQMGLYSYNPVKDKFDILLENTNDPKSAITSEVICINEDSLQNLWIGTNHGFFSYNLNDSSFQFFNKSTGVDVAMVYNIIKYKNNIWYTTNTGLYRYDVSSQNVKHYGRNEGVRNIEYNFPGIFASDKRIYFGGLEGITTFFPGELSEKKTNPEVIFTGLSIDLDQVKPGQEVYGTVPISESINSVKEIKLKYLAKIFTLDFAILDLAALGKASYAYKIDEKEDWIKLGNESSITFVNQPPGKFRLTVKGTNANGEWSKQTASVLIEVIPPWWKRTVFRVSFLLFVLLSIYLIYKYNEGKLIRDKKKLESMVLKRTEEIQTQNEHIQEQRDEILYQRDELERHKDKLEERVKTRTTELEKAKLKAEESDRLKSAFLSNLSHEIRTPLNAIIGFSQLIKKKKDEEKDNYLDIIIQNGESLSDLISDIIDISKIEAQQIDIHMALFDLTDVLERINKSFRELHTNENVQFIMNLPTTDVVLIYTDKVRLTQIIANLVNNALKFTSIGKVEFGYREQETEYLFYIEDTGIGIAKENHRNVFNRFYKIENSSDELFKGTGLGLAICENLSYLLGGEIWLESELEKGSTFYFTIPKKDNSANS